MVITKKLIMLLLAMIVCVVICALIQLAIIILLLLLLYIIHIPMHCINNCDTIILHNLLTLMHTIHVNPCILLRFVYYNVSFLLLKSLNFE